MARSRSRVDDHSGDPLVSCCSASPSIRAHRVMHHETWEHARAQVLRRPARFFDGNRFAFRLAATHADTSAGTGPALPLPCPGGGASSPVEVPRDPWPSTTASQDSASSGAAGNKVGPRSATVRRPGGQCSSPPATRLRRRRLCIVLFHSVRSEFSIERTHLLR